MKFLSLIPDVTKIRIFWLKLLISAELNGVWHVFYISFGSSLVKVMICITDLSRGHFFPF